MRFERVRVRGRGGQKYSLCRRPDTTHRLSVPIRSGGSSLHSSPARRRIRYAYLSPVRTSKTASAKTRNASTRPRAPASDAIAPIRGRARALECYHFPLEYNRAIGPRPACNRCARRGLSRAIASLVFECALAKGCWRRDACRAMGEARLYSSGHDQGTRGTQMTHI